MQEYACLELDGRRLQLKDDGFGCVGANGERAENEGGGGEEEETGGGREEGVSDSHFFVIHIYFITNLFSNVYLVQL